MTRSVTSKKGSKFNVMKGYRDYLENCGFDTLFVNGFLETTSEKQLLDVIYADFVDSTGKENDANDSVIKKIINFYSKPEAPILFIFINNIESGLILESRL